MKLSQSPNQSPVQRLGARFAIVAALSGLPACNSTTQDVPRTPSSLSPEEALKQLHAEFHTNRSDTRTATEPHEDHPESTDIARRSVALRGYMDPKEVKLMQEMHEEIYEQYLNPAFIQYLKQRGLSDTVFPVLNTIVRDPEAFEYINKGDSRIEIIKRRPHNTDEDRVFKVVISTSEKEVTEINGTDLTPRDGSIPWMSNSEYNHQMSLHRDRMMSEYRLHRDSNWEQKLQELENLQEPERTRRWQQLLLGPYGHVSEPMKDLYVLDNIEFPRRFIELVEARNFDFERNDPRFRDLVRHQALQGSTYDEITQQGYGPNGHLQVIVLPDPDHDGVYQIYTRGMRARPLLVDRHGYMLTEEPDGDLVADPRIHQAVRRRYYDTHRNAPRHIR